MSSSVYTPSCKCPFSEITTCTKLEEACASSCLPTENAALLSSTHAGTLPKSHVCNKSKAWGCGACHSVLHCSLRERLKFLRNCHQSDQRKVRNVGKGRGRPPPLPTILWRPPAPSRWFGHSKELRNTVITFFFFFFFNTEIHITIKDAEKLRSGEAWPLIPHQYPFRK